MHAIFSMSVLLSLVLGFIAAALAGLVTVFFTEVVAGLWSAPRDNGSKALGGRPVVRIAVLIPAHNESVGLVPTLIDIRRQLGARDKVVVVADNCSDDTAAVATANGADVIERRDLARRGKSYALDFGLEHLSSSPPDIVIMVDADCRIAHGAVDALARICTATHRPTQALYLMTPPPVPQINQRVAEFAWRVKNWVRPSGLAALGLPCQLVGTGMAFPWDVIRSVDLASGSLVEDLKLGLDLAENGHPPIFCPSALVMSQFALTTDASRTQRERWEGGHITTILTVLPRLLIKALARGDLNLLAMTLDLMVPPLSLLALLAVVVLVATFLWAALGFTSLPFFLSVVSFFAFTLASFLAWLRRARDILPISQLPSIMSYILKKLGLYRAILFGKASRSWTRTER